MFLKVFFIFIIYLPKYPCKYFTLKSKSMRDSAVTGDKSFFTLVSSSKPKTASFLPVPTLICQYCVLYARDDVRRFVTILNTKIPTEINVETFRNCWLIFTPNTCDEK